MLNTSIKRECKHKICLHQPSLSKSNYVADSFDPINENKHRASKSFSHESKLADRSEPRHRTPPAHQSGNAQPGNLQTIAKTNQPYLFAFAYSSEFRFNAFFRQKLVHCGMPVEEHDEENISTTRRNECQSACLSNKLHWRSPVSHHRNIKARENRRTKSDNSRSISTTPMRHEMIS